MESRSSLNHEVLFERYPELGLLLAYEPLKDPAVSCDSEAVLRAWHQALPIGDAEVVYLFGMGSGFAYTLFKPWLDEKKGRKLIIIDDDLNSLLMPLLEEENQAMIRDPQVHLTWLVRKQRFSILETLIRSFPSPKIAVFATPSYAAQKDSFFKKSRLYLLRKTAVSDALLTEALYAHELIVNVLSNIKQWEKSFFANGLAGQFQGVPAVICGAGPSLSTSIPLLKTLGDKALIFAGGSTIAALSNQGVIPHIGLAFDPNPEEYSRLRISSAFEIPLLYGTRVEPTIFHASNGPLGYLRSFTGGPCETYFEGVFSLHKDPIGTSLGKEAFSVTTLAIALAVALGCHPIILNGIDLSYTGMQRYAEGITPSSSVSLEEILKETRASEQLLRRKGIQGKMLYTLVKWVMESECISAYAKKHKDVTWVNVSPNGLGFAGIRNASFEEVIQLHCTRSWDLKGKVHAYIQELRLHNVDREKVLKKMEELQSSLSRLLKINDEILTELKLALTENAPFPLGKMTLLQLDFEEESAFDCFLSHVGPSLDQLLNRSFGDGCSLERHIAKWEHFKEVIVKHERHVAQALIF